MIRFYFQVVIKTHHPLFIFHLGRYPLWFHFESIPYIFCGFLNDIDFSCASSLVAFFCRIVSPLLSFFCAFDPASAGTPPTLYYYFGSKEGLLEAVCQSHYRELNRLITENAVCNSYPESYDEDVCLMLTYVIRQKYLESRLILFEGFIYLTANTRKNYEPTPVRGHTDLSCLHVFIGRGCAWGLSQVGKCIDAAQRYQLCFVQKSVFPVLKWISRKMEYPF